MWTLFWSALAHATGLTAPVHPTRMAISLDVDPAADSFHGRVSIALEIEQPLASFALYAEELELETISIARRAERRTLEPRRIDDARVELMAEAPLEAGAWTLEIAYVGPVHRQPYGLYRFEVDGQPYLVTQLEADEARTAWPCFDEPRFKVPHAFEVTAPEGLAVISNGIVRARRTAGGRTTHTFRETPPIPTYGAALAVGDYVALPVAGTSVPATIWSPRGAEGDLSLVADAIVDALPRLERWFGIRYPYRKLDWILVPSFAFGAMENPAAVVMTAEYLPKVGEGTVRERREIAEIVSHELAHMWFGNLVTLEWWDDLWLNEAFADWLGDRFADERYPEVRGEVREVRQLYNMLNDDGVATERPIRTPVDPKHVFETTNLGAAYRKGSALLDATLELLGEDTLRKGLRRYLNTHAHGNAVASDLFAALTRVSGTDIGAFLGPYLDRAGGPRIAVRRSGDAFTLEQSRYWRHPGEGTTAEEPWPVPVRFRIGHADGTTSVETRWLRDASAVVTLEDAVWIMPQADAIGYYTFALDDDLLSALLARIGALSARERMAVVRSLELEADAGRRTAAQQLELVDAFAAERDPTILAQLVAIVGQVRMVRFAHDPAMDRLADEYVQRRLRPWLDRIGLERTGTETADVEELRRALLEVLGLAGDEAALSYARELTRRALEDPASVPPERLDWALASTAREGDPAMAERLLALADETAVPSLRSSLLDAAAAVRHPTVRAEALARALRPDTAYQDMGPLLGGALGATEPFDDAGIERDLEWVFTHADTLEERMPPVHRGRLVTLAKTACDVSRADRVAAFFAEPARRSVGVDRRVAELLDETRACAAQRAVHLPSLVRYLQTQP
jgi:cytosol alanyl aminopeptidase